MFLVTGGYDEWGYSLDSTETFDPLLGSWAHSGAKLPRPMSGLQAEIIDDRLLFFGIHYLIYIINIVQYTIIIYITGGYSSVNGNNYADILEYDPEEDTMTIVGHMTQGRSSHALSVVRVEDYLPWCQ